MTTFLGEIHPRKINILNPRTDLIQMMFLFHWVIFRFKMIIFRQTKTAFCHDVPFKKLYMWLLMIAENRLGVHFVRVTVISQPCIEATLFLVESSRYETTTQGVFCSDPKEDFGWRFYPRNSQHDRFGIHPPRLKCPLKRDYFGREYIFGTYEFSGE